MRVPNCEECNIERDQLVTECDTLRTAYEQLRAAAYADDQRLQSYESEIKQLQLAITESQSRISFLETYVGDFDRLMEAESAVKILARLLTEAIG